MARLTDKQRVFVEEFLRCWNATEAARRAGYRGNDNTLGVVGWKNLRKAKIAAKIQQRLAEKAMAADEVLARLSEQARADLGDFLSITADGVEIDLNRARGKTHLLKSFRQSETGIRIELYSAQEALEKLGRAHGLFVDRQKVEHEGEVVHKVKIIRPPNDE